MTGKPETLVMLINVLDLAALAQFVLLGAAFIWFIRRRSAPAEV